jgi:hypothetical protein
MKTALIMMDGAIQVVLTPETAEDKLVAKLIKGPYDVRVHGGVHFEVIKTMGGYMRQETNDESTVLVLTPAKPKCLPMDAQ